jgi:DNA-binding transcriptional ArsR family regulator
MRRDVFQAIADPTRREIIHLIARKPLPLNSIAENFAVSRPAISKHIKILTECGIVTIHSRGRERYCEARLQKLSEVSQWVDHFRVYWNQKLDALGEFLEKEEAAAPRKTGKERGAAKAPAKKKKN